MRKVLNEIVDQLNTKNCYNAFIWYWFLTFSQINIKYIMKYNYIYSVIQHTTINICLDTAHYTIVQFIFQIKMIFKLYDNTKILCLHMRTTIKIGHLRLFWESLIVKLVVSYLIVNHKLKECINITKT